LTITKANTDTYYDLDITVEPCSQCLEGKQDEIDTLEADLEDAERWESECSDLEAQIQKLENDTEPEPGA
jgi:hypothetical protein